MLASELDAEKSVFAGKTIHIAKQIRDRLREPIVHFTERRPMIENILEECPRAFRILV